MCGRYTLTAEPEAIQQAFNLDSVPLELMPRFNIAPSQAVPIITNENPHQLTFVKWGLIPSWSKDASIGNSLINARAETLAEKPSFRAAFKRRRCLIPADGFYEWPKKGNQKSPVYIHLPNHEVFAFAGLWETWHSPLGDEILSCTIITTEPNDAIKPLHHRMAVILDKADYEEWLSPEEMPAAALMPMLRQVESERMTIYPVSTMVNSPANDDPRLIDPAIPPGQQVLL